MKKRIFFFSLDVLTVFLGLSLLITARAAYAATLSLTPSTGSHTVGTNFNVDVALDTAGSDTDGVDLHYLRFTQSLLKLESVSLGSLYSNTLTNTIDNISGTYDFSQTAVGGMYYNGSGTLLTLTFSVLSAGTAKVSFDYTSGSSLDCNVAFAGSDILSGVTNGSYTLAGSGDGNVYADGSLLKSPDDKVYLLENQQKRWIISLEAFESCNYNWDVVKVVSQAVIDQYLNGADFYGCPHEILLIKTFDNPAVYQISQGTKRHLPSIEVFESYGYIWDAIQIVSQASLDAYPRTELIKTNADPKVYYFSATRTRRWIPSGEIFDAYGFGWDKVVIINQTEMAVYPDCRVIKTAASPDVYQLSGTIKRKITSTQAYETLGYRWEDINVVSQLEFGFYQTGEPYSI